MKTASNLSASSIRQIRRAGSGSAALLGRLHGGQAQGSAQDVRPQEILLGPRRQGRLLRVHARRRRRQEGHRHVRSRGELNVPTEEFT